MHVWIISPTLEWLAKLCDTVMAGLNFGYIIDNIAREAFRQIIQVKNQPARINLLICLALRFGIVVWITYCLYFGISLRCLGIL